MRTGQGGGKRPSPELPELRAVSRAGELRAGVRELGVGALLLTQLEAAYF